MPLTAAGTGRFRHTAQNCKPKTTGQEISSDEQQTLFCKAAPLQIQLQPR
jgi:hypothetical protein